jgi:HlyD family secretion protein
MNYVALCFALALVGAGCSKKSSDALEASGLIETTDVNIGSKVAGTLLALRVREGDAVKVGDTLAVIDVVDLQLQAAQLRAGVDLAKAQYDALRNGARIEDLSQAEEAALQAKANRDNASDDFKRFEELHRQGSISQKQFDDAKTRYDVAVRQFNVAEWNYKKIKRGSRSEDLAAAKARWAQAQAQLAAAEKKIADGVLLAPMSGVVTKCAVEEGEFVNMATSILTISKLDWVKLKIYVAENELGKVKLGQSATLKIDTYADRTYIGKVTYISPVAEFTPKNVQTKDDRVKLVFKVQLTAPNPNGDLKAGLTADAVLDVSETATIKKGEVQNLK